MLAHLLIILSCLYEGTAWTEVPAVAPVSMILIIIIIFITENSVDACTPRSEVYFRTFKWPTLQRSQRKHRLLHPPTLSHSTVHFELEYWHEHLCIDCILCGILTIGEAVTVTCFSSIKKSTLHCKTQNFCGKRCWVSFSQNNKFHDLRSSLFYGTFQFKAVSS